MGKPSRPLLAKSTRCIAFKKKKHRARVQPCFVRVKVLQLYPVVFCVVTAVLTFDFRLVTNETPNEWDQSK